MIIIKVILVIVSIVFLQNSCKLSRYLLQQLSFDLLRILGHDQTDQRCSLHCQDFFKATLWLPRN